MYKKIKNYKGYTNIEQVEKYLDDEVFYYGTTEQDSEDAIKELLSDGENHEDQLSAYGKYLLDGTYLVAMVQKEQVMKKYIVKLDEVFTDDMQVIKEILWR